MGSLFPFNHTRLPPTPFNMPETLRYSCTANIMHIEGQKTPAVCCQACQQVIHVQFQITWMLWESVRGDELSFKDIVSVLLVHPLTITPHLPA